MSATRINAMPAITWHRLNMNWAELELPDAPVVRDGAIPFPVALEEGVGAEAADWMRSVAADWQCVTVSAGQTLAEPITVHVDAVSGSTAIAGLDVVVEADASARIIVHADAAKPGSGMAGTVVRVFAAAGSHVFIESLQTMADGYTHVDSVGIVEEEGARVDVTQIVLGAAASYTGFACHLAGDESSCRVDTRYLGHGAHVVDFNYLMRQYGRATTCQLDAQGVLLDSSVKTLRGTIDLVHGCKGSVGTEHETVLIASDDVRNKTIPIILCDEDDVQGSHGATIGHVNPEQLEYLTSRGLDLPNIEALFATAIFDHAAANAATEDIRSAVKRLATSTLGARYDSIQGDE